MLRSQRLSVVLTLEERKEKAALEKMAEAQQHHEAQRQQIENLERYQREYREQIRSSQKGEAREATEFELETFEHAEVIKKRESGHAEIGDTLVVWRPIGGADWTYVVVGPSDDLLE